jgi:hypothetical protein
MRIWRLKAETPQQYHDKNGIKFRSRLIGNTPIINKLFASMRSLYFSTKGLLGTLVKMTGFTDDGAKFAHNA